MRGFLTAVLFFAAAVVFAVHAQCAMEDFAKEIISDIDCLTQNIESDNREAARLITEKLGRELYGRRGWMEMLIDH